MLLQMIPALQTLHGVGYAHGDIKLDNICAQVRSDNELSFTLIDFGLCRKLPVPGNYNEFDSYFSGNKLFASAR